MNSETPQSSTSIVGLLQSLRDDTTTLLRQEVELAKVEVGRNVARIGSHTAEIAIGGFVAYAGLIVLLIGLGHLIGVGLARAGMDQEVAEWLAPAIVGVAIGIVGFLMMVRAKRALAEDPVAPRATVSSLKEDKDWAQSKLHPSRS